MDAAQRGSSLTSSCGSCALCSGDIGVSILCHHLQCSLWWMDPCEAFEWMAPGTGPDYKLSDKGEQGELISKSGHCSLALCKAAEPPSPFCISMMLCVLGRVRDTCLRVREPLALHQPPALNEHNWLWWDLRSRDNTGGLFRLFVIRLFQVLQCIQYQLARVLVFFTAHCKRFASGLLTIMLTGAPGAPGGPKIAPPLWKDIFLCYDFIFDNMGQMHFTDRHRCFPASMIEGTVSFIQWITMTLSLS